MENNLYAVIMAGGGGTRLWPLSRKKFPKQMIPIVDGKSLFQIAVHRLEGLVDPDHILVVTIAEQVEMLKKQSPQIPDRNYLIEPMPRGTAAVVGYAAVYLRKIDPGAIMAVLTADHVMENTPYFKDLLHNAADLAATGTLVTIGIKPEFASTGYGYIEAGKQVTDKAAFQVKRFVEKPAEEKAAEYIQSGNYYWNSGMFIWKIDAILYEIKRQMPTLFEHLVQVDAQISPEGKIGDIQSVWHGIEAQTIDYGIMEGAQNVTLIPAEDLGWKDLGSWDALFDILKPDTRGNIRLAEQILDVDAKNNLIQTTDKNRVIAAIGVEDLIIVDHQNTLLICKRGQSQKVKTIVNHLKDAGLEDYL